METDYPILLILKVHSAYITINSSSEKNVLFFSFAFCSASEMCFAVQE